MSSSSAADFLREVFYRNTKKVFLVDVGTGKEFTYGDIEQQSLALASLLGTFVKKGDRVACILPNSIEGSLLYFACMHLGVVIVPINQRLSREEVQIILEEATPQLLVTTPLLQKEKGLPGNGLPGTRILSISVRYTADTYAQREQGDDGIDLFAEAEKRGQYAGRSFDTVDDDDLLAVVYTSGTTSRPKGVPITFGRLVKNARMFIAAQGLPPGIRFLGTFSQGYLGGLYNTLLFQFIAEGSVALDAGFTADTALRFWETAEKHEVTALWLVPSILSILLSVDRGTAGEAYAPAHLKYVFVGTAPLSVAIKASFEKRYGITLYENYALSETFFITSDTSSLREHKGVGTVLPGCRITIMSGDSAPCPAGTPGEIVIESEYMASAYFKNPAETEKAFRHGKFYTGDVGYLDPEGYLFVTGRKKDIIIRGGINVSPKEIEDVITGILGVREAAVVGVPHPVTGEEIVAACVGDSLDIEAVRRECAARLAPFKVPARIYIVSALPKSPTGKVQKHKVKELILTLSV